MVSRFQVSNEKIKMWNNPNYTQKKKRFKGTKRLPDDGYKFNENPT